MNRKPGDLPVVMVLAGAGVVVTLLGVANPLARALFALPLVLVLPGYALLAATFPRRALDGTARLALSVGVSLAVACLGGFLLHWTPAGLRAESWALLLGGVTLGAGAVALGRRGPAAPVTRLAGRPGPGQWLLFSLAALVVAGAVGVAVTGARQQRAPGFTQLWMTPANDAARDDTVYLGVNSFEAVAARYNLQLVVGGDIVREWQALELEPGGRWVVRVELPALEPDIRTVEAVLYRLDDPETVYRRVQVWRRS